MKNPLFIIGCPRSGTTLLAGLLKKSEYGSPVESHFMTKYYKKLDSYGDIKNKENFNRLLKDILNERSVMQWKLQIDFNRFYDELEDISFGKIANKLCMQRAENKGYKSWGDKTPYYILDIDIIYQLFPESRYIYVVRDGRDVALSLFGREWEPFNILTCAELWKRCNVHNSTLDELRNRKQLYFVRYEDLLDNAEQIVPEIYEFLNEEYNDSEMRKLLASIRKGNYNKWKNKMNERQIELFERTASNTLRRFGYETSYEESEINLLTKSVYSFHESIMRAKFLFKINLIDGIKIKYFGKEPFAD